MEGIENDDDIDEEIEAYNLSLTEYLQYFEKTYIGYTWKKGASFVVNPRMGLVLKEYLDILGNRMNDD